MVARLHSVQLPVDPLWACAPARERRVLGDYVDIDIEAYDEINSVVPVKRIVREFRRNRNCGLVCLVGVQTNQFARALDIAREFRTAGIEVAIGGFHVSGCVAMLAELPAELKEAQALGITLFAGEAEGRLDELLQAAYQKRLRPLYNFINDLPYLDGSPVPFLPRRNMRRYVSMKGCFDAGRGCPFTCSFCTIINVQGRKSRFRTVKDIEDMIRSTYAEGVRDYLITDDNFARNRIWEKILDRLIELREEHGFKISFMIQVDTLAHKTPGFVTKAARAGCTRVCIGLESINPDSLKSVSKGQNRITEYRRMLQMWHSARVITYAGIILGFPADTPETIERDIRIIQKELPIDLVHFFILTPLPGSKDHQDLHLRGARMESDTNRYDTEHVTTNHPQMSVAEWESIYRKAWQLYYTPEHIAVLLKRAVASSIPPRRLALAIFYYYYSQVFEGVHPLQGGVFRRKIRTLRRAAFPRENPLFFYSRRVKEVFGTYFPALRFLWRLHKLCRRIESDPIARTYSDIATSPATEHTEESLQLYQQTAAARRALTQARARATGVQKQRETGLNT